MTKAVEVGEANLSAEQDGLIWAQGVFDKMLGSKKMKEYFYEQSKIAVEECWTDSRRRY